MRRMMRWLWVIAVALMVPSLHAASIERRVLFVGNSLTYFNNLPAAFASLAPPGEAVVVDAFARPGERLLDDLDDPLLARLLARGGYTDVVFQERGGDAVCMPGSGACRELSAAAQASAQLAAAARAGGARVFYLGTWQVNPIVEPALIHGERMIARRMQATYIPIGHAWLALRAAQPDTNWLAPDGQHPGHATTALLAVRSWQAVTGRSPTRAPCVGGALYTHMPSADGFFRVNPDARPRTCLVSPALMRSMLGAP